MQNLRTAASVCLLLSSVLVGAMGLIWLVIFVVGLAVGAGLGVVAAASAVFEIGVPIEMMWAGGGLWAILMAAITGLSIVNLFSGAIGIVASIRGYLTGGTWGVRLAAGLQIAMALVFGLPGAITMNPLALIWLAVLVLAIATLGLMAGQVRQRPG